METNKQIVKILRSDLIDRYMIAKFGNIPGKEDGKMALCGFQLSANNEIAGFESYEEAKMWCDLNGLDVDVDDHVHVIHSNDELYNGSLTPMHGIFSDTMLDPISFSLRKIN